MALADAPMRSDRADSLDALRFMLALWVLCAHLAGWAHATAPAWFTGCMAWLHRLLQPTGETHPAVLAFIVLSGYCIHRNGLRVDAFDLRAYAMRRAFRILPIFVLASMVGAFVGATVMNDKTISGTDLALKLLGVSAFFPSLNAATYQGNAPLHTVMVEIWLYAVYPAVLWFLIQGWLGERAMWLLMAAIWLIGIALCSADALLRDWWHNGSLASFLLYWWIGARFVAKKPSLTITIGCVVSWAFLSWVILGGTATSLVVVEARKLVFAILTASAIVALDALALRLPWVGRAGYSLYAFHAPVGLGLLFMGMAWWSAALGALLVGRMAYLLIEAPLTELGKSVARGLKARAPPQPIT